VNALRPTRLAEVVGHSKIRRTLAVLIKAALRKGEPLPHLLFAGPPGLGKTTMAAAIACEMNAPMAQAHAEGLSLDVIRDQLQLIDSGTVLFIDEIHSLPTKAAEIYYGVMEDGNFTLAGTSVDVPPLTVIGATTHSGSLPEPLRRRFGHIFTLDFLAPQDLAMIAWNTAWRLGATIKPDACWAVAIRSKGTPRRAVQLTQWIADFGRAHGINGTWGAAELVQRPILSAELARQALQLRGTDVHGLEEIDRRYLAVLAKQFRNGPAGVRALAAALGEPEVTLIREVEPWLVRRGWIALAPSGRVRVGAPASQKVAPPRRRSLGKAKQPAEKPKRRPARLKLQ